MPILFQVKDANGGSIKFAGIMDAVQIEIGPWNVEFPVLVVNQLVADLVVIGSDFLSQIGPIRHNAPAKLAMFGDVPVSTLEPTGRGEERRGAL